MATFSRGVAQATFVGSDGVSHPVSDVTVRQDGQWVDGSEPDPTWRYEDAAGHQHRWIKFRGEDIVTATEWEEETYWCVDCHEVHDERWRACTHCGEVVSPRYRSKRSYIPGLVEMTALIVGNEVALPETGRVIVGGKAWPVVCTSVEGVYGPDRHFRTTSTYASTGSPEDVIGTTIPVAQRIA